MYQAHSRDVDLFEEVIPTIESNISRFRKFGSVLTRQLKNADGEVAKIGRIEKETGPDVYVIFYPDGTYDRFEDGEDSVVYRDGWNGPNLHIKKASDTIVEEMLQAKDELEGKSTEKLPAALESLLTSKPKSKKPATKKCAVIASMVDDLEQKPKRKATPKKTVAKKAVAKKAARKTSTLH